MPHERVCFSQRGQRLFDFLRRGVRALDVPHHLLRQHRKPCGAIYVAVSRGFKVEGRDHHGNNPKIMEHYDAGGSIFVRRSLASITRR